jgi:hypothetical protein
MSEEAAPNPPGLFSNMERRVKRMSYETITYETPERELES